MSILAERLEAVEAKKTEVKNHCMCFSFEEDPTHFRVFYPAGYFPHGAQVDKSLGKAAALSKLLEAMEKAWHASFP